MLPLVPRSSVMPEPASVAEFGRLGIVGAREPLRGHVPVPGRPAVPGERSGSGAGRCQEHYGLGQSEEEQRPSQRADPTHASTPLPLMRGHGAEHREPRRRPRSLLARNASRLSPRMQCHSLKQGTAKTAGLKPQPPYSFQGGNTAITVPSWPPGNAQFGHGARCIIGAVVSSS